MSYPFKAFPESKSKPRKLSATLALMSGMALLSTGSLSAADRVYGHAEVTVGGPNVQITVGKTWETGNRNCDRTEKVVYEEKDDYEIEKRVIYTDDEECHHREHGNIIVYRDHPRCVREIREIRYEEPVRCDRDIRIIRENEPTRCDRGTRVVEVIRSRPVERVVVIGRPQHRVVVVNGPDRNCDRNIIVTRRGDYDRHSDRKVIVTDRGHSRHDGPDRKIIVTDRDPGRGHDRIEYKDRGHDKGDGKMKKEHSDNGRHYGENYEHSDHTSRRDLNDRPSKRVTRERGQSGRML